MGFYDQIVPVEQNQEDKNFYSNIKPSGLEQKEQQEAGDFYSKIQPIESKKSEGMPASQAIKEAAIETSKAALGTAESIVNIGGGAITWLPGWLAREGQVVLQKMRNDLIKSGYSNLINKIDQMDVSSEKKAELIHSLDTQRQQKFRSPEQIRQMGIESQELISGIIPEPTTKMGKAVVGNVGKAFEAALHPIKVAVDFYIPKEYPNLRDTAQFLTELGAFKVAHIGGKKALGKIKELAKKGKFKEADQAAKDFLNKEEIDLEEIKTPEGRREVLYRQYEEKAAKQRAESVGIRPPDVLKDIKVQKQERPVNKIALPSPRPLRSELKPKTAKEILEERRLEDIKRKESRDAEKITEMREEDKTSREVKEEHLDDLREDKAETVPEKVKEKKELKVDLDEYPDWVEGELENLYNEVAEVPKTTRMHQVAVEVLDKGTIKDPGLYRTFKRWYDKESKILEKTSEEPIQEAYDNVTRTDPETGRPAGAELAEDVDKLKDTFEDVWEERRKADAKKQKTYADAMERRRIRLGREKEEPVKPVEELDLTEKSAEDLIREFHEQEANIEEIPSDPDRVSYDELMKTSDDFERAQIDLETGTSYFDDLWNERGAIDPTVFTKTVSEAVKKLKDIYGINPKAGSLYNQLLKKGMSEDDLNITGVGLWLKKKNPQERISWEEMRQELKGSGLKLEKIVYKRSNIKINIEKAIDNLNLINNALEQIKRERRNLNDNALEQFNKEQINLNNEFNTYIKEYKKAQTSIDTRIKNLLDARIQAKNHLIELKKIDDMSKPLYSPTTHPSLNLKGDIEGTYQETLYRYQPKSGEYIEGHWNRGTDTFTDLSGKNVMIHKRGHERFLTDDTKVRHIDEIQSGWHQQGGVECYKTYMNALTFLFNFADKYKIKLKNRSKDRILSLNIKKRLIDKAESLDDTIYKKVLDALDDLEFGDTKVPDAPFKRTWYKIPLRDTVQEAVKAGDEGITWTTGKQQAARYNRFADAYEWKKEKGVIELKIFKDGIELKKMLYDSNNFKQMADEVGKKITRDIKTEIDKGMIKGKNSGDILVDAELYKRLYDKNFVKFFKSEYGVKAELRDTQITNKKPIIRESNGEFDVYGIDNYLIRSFSNIDKAIHFLQEIEIKPEKVWYVPITDKMKALHTEGLFGKHLSEITNLLGDESGFINIGNMLESAKKYLGKASIPTVIGYKDLTPHELKSLRAVVAQAESKNVSVEHYLKESKGLSEDVANRLSELAAMDKMPERPPRKRTGELTKEQESNYVQSLNEANKKLENDDAVLQFSKIAREKKIKVDDYVKGSLEPAELARPNISKEVPTVMGDVPNTVPFLKRIHPVWKAAKDIPRFTFFRSPHHILDTVLSTDNSFIIDANKAKMSYVMNRMNGERWAKDVKDLVPKATDDLDTALRPIMEKLDPIISDMKKNMKRIAMYKRRLRKGKKADKELTANTIKKINQRIKGQSEKISKRINEYYDKVMPELAKQHPSIRIVLHAGGELPEGIKLSPQELTISKSVRKYMDQIGDRLDKVGIPTQKENYITHLWKNLIGDEDVKSMIGFDRANKIPEMLSWKHQLPGTRIWYPDLHSILDSYIPVATKRLAFQEVLNRWEEPMLVDLPKRTGNYIKSLWNENYYYNELTLGQKLVNAFVNYEFVRIIGASLSVAMKHFAGKLPGTPAEAGFKATGQAISEVAKIPIQKFMKVMGKKGRTAELDAFSIYNNLSAYVKLFDESPGVKASLAYVKAASASPVLTIELMENGISVLAQIHKACNKNISFLKAHNQIWQTILDVNFRGDWDMPRGLKNPGVRALAMFQATPIKLVEYKYKLLKDALMNKQDNFGTSGGSKMMRLILMYGIAESFARSQDTTLLEMLFHIPFVSNITNKDIALMGSPASQILAGKPWKDIPKEMLTQTQIRKYYRASQGKYARSYYDSPTKAIFGLRSVEKEHIRHKGKSFNFIEGVKDFPKEVIKSYTGSYKSKTRKRSKRSKRSKR